MGIFTGTAADDLIQVGFISAGVTGVGTPGAGVDFLFGGDGNDTLQGGLGDDQMFGGAGDDLVYGGVDFDIADGGAGIDSLAVFDFSGNYTINLTTGQTNFAGELFTNFENLYSGSGDDNLTGTSGRNIIAGGNGNDTITAGGGDDYVFVGLGLDVAYGGNGTDSLDTSFFDEDYTVNLTTGLTNFAGELYEGFENHFSGDGNDLLTGTAGGNLISGGGGNDTVNATAGNDTVFGGDGDDVIFLGSGIMVATGGDGIDRADASLIGQDYLINLTTALSNINGEEFLGFENLTMGIGNDTLIGTSGINNLDGGAGDDRFDGVEGDDTVTGGAGSDTLVVNDLVFYHADGGDDTDTIDMTAVTFGTAVNLETGEVSSGESYVNFENILSGSGDDQLTGSSADNLIDGGAGDDIIFASGGFDTLNGGDGDDVLVLGNDFANGNGGFGVDTIDTRAIGSDFHFTLLNGLSGFPGEVYFNFENLITGTGDDTLVGTSAANAFSSGGGTDILVGLGGKDILRGQGGADTLEGGLGKDRLVGGNGNDVFVFTDGAKSVGTNADVLAAGDGGPAFGGAGAALGDLIDLRGIDANTTLANDQAFVFGGAGKGRVQVISQGTNSVVQGNTDNDAQFEFELIIQDGGVLASAYVAADFML